MNCQEALAQCGGIQLTILSELATISFGLLHLVQPFQTLLNTITPGVIIRRLSYHIVCFRFRDASVRGHYLDVETGFVLRKYSLDKLQQCRYRFELWMITVVENLFLLLSSVLIWTLVEDGFYFGKGVPLNDD